MTQKENKIRHDEVRKGINWELCKKLKFYHTTKWYMHKSKSVLENQMYKILWEFEIQTNHQIPARKTKPNDDLQKQTTSRIVEFAVPTDH